MNDELRAVGWCVLVIEDKLLAKTASGINLAVMSRLPPCTGHIYSVGSDAQKEHPELCPGQWVHFKPFCGREFSWRDLNFRAVAREDLLAIVSTSPLPFGDD
jgi:co-chaperonin GroES (HSP10)